LSISTMATRRAFVVGGRITPFMGARHPDFIWKRHPLFGKKKNPGLENYIRDAVNGALKDTGVAASAIDKIWIGNFCGELFNSQGHLGAAVVGSNPDLLYKPAMRIEGACASGALTFACGLDAIKAGTADVALIVGAECQTTVDARTGGDYLARAAHYERQRPIDQLTFPALFAARIKACKEAGIVTDSDLAILSAKAYGNGNLNPLAHMHAVKMDVESAMTVSRRNPTFLANKDLHPYLRLSDCSQVSDGGAALLLVSEDGLKKIGKTLSDAIEVRAFNVATGNLYEDGDPLSFDTTAAAASKTYAEAGLQASDIDVAEVHDCFTIAELLAIEALGFAGKGKGADLVREGALNRDGSIPTNTGGGLLSFGHPVGATGVKQILEIHRQMKGKCGEYQLSSIPSFGLTANMGGDDKTAVVGIFENCA